MFEAFVFVSCSSGAALMVAIAIWCLKEALRHGEMDHEEIARAEMRSLSWPSKDVQTG
jgi:hypothetical protein